MRPAFVYGMIGSLCLVFSIAAFLFIIGSGTRPGAVYHENSGYSADLEFQRKLMEVHDARERQGTYDIGTGCLSLGILLEFFTAVSFINIQKESRSRTNRRSVLAVVCLLAMIIGYVILDGSATDRQQAVIETYASAMCGAALMLLLAVFSRYVLLDYQATQRPAAADVPDGKS